VSHRPTSPSFNGLSPASDLASRVKRANRRVDTVPEIILRRELWRLGLRYRKNVASLPGRPDIVFTRARVAVFCDGDFWHGKDWPSLQPKLAQGSNARYWEAKISRNMARDLENSELLSKDGWMVVRLWETDIKREPVAIACRVKDIVRSGQTPQSATDNCEAGTTAIDN
jgi:DNA mismatch endonuclease, patch repair protein